jgi:hypothetical protein
VTVDAIGVDGFAAMVELADLEAVLGPLWNAIEGSVLPAIQNEDREVLRRKELSRLEPADNLPLRDSQRFEPGEELSRPGPGGQDQRPGLVARALGFDLDAVAHHFEVPHGLMFIDLGAKPARHRRVRLNGAVGQQNAGIGLQHGLELAWQLPGRKAAADLARPQHLMRQAVRLAGKLCATNNPPRGQTNIKPAGCPHKGLAEITLQHLPSIKRQPHQRDVAGVLEVGKTKDAR